jgi:DNA gyrase subunit B
VRYTYTDAEMRATLKDLEKKGKRWKDPIQRYKGLGEMDAAQLRDTTMAIGSRQLRRINVKDAEVASRVFDLLMGSDVAPRKEFIIAGAGSLDRESIDA